MTFRKYLLAVKENWLLGTTAIIVGIIASGALYFATPLSYGAKITFYISAQNSSDSTSGAYEGAQLAQSRVTSYIDLISSARVMSSVITDLGLDEDVEGLQAQISATSKTNSVLIDVTATSTSATLSTNIVNSVGRLFPQVVQELERPADPRQPTPVQARLVQPATVPTEPSSLGLRIHLLFGLIAGLASGLVGVALRTTLDTRIKSAEQLQDVFHSPVIGTIPRTTRNAATGDRPPTQVSAESYRTLRTNLQFLDVDNPPRTVMITSSIAAEGKTTSVVNLALSIGSVGLRVLIVEADLRQPRASGMLGLDRSAGLTNVLAGRLPYQQAIQTSNGGQVDILASGPIPPNPGELLSTKQMRSLLEQLSTEYDYVLVDSPPLLPVADAAAIAALVDGVIFVARYKTVNEQQVRYARQALESVSAAVLGTILTVAPEPKLTSYDHYAAFDAASTEKPQRPQHHVNQSSRPTLR